jgi:hypothetical protein
MKLLETKEMLAANLLRPGSFGLHRLPDNIRPQFHLRPKQSVHHHPAKERLPLRVQMGPVHGAFLF